VQRLRLELGLLSTWEPTWHSLKEESKNEIQFMLKNFLLI